MRDFHRSYVESGLCAAITTWLASIPSDVETPLLSAENRARFHAWCGEKDRAFDWLRQALEQEDPEIILIRSYPPYDKLRDDPRFDAFLEKAGLSKIEIPQASTTP